MATRSGNGVAPVCNLIRSQVLPEPKRQLIPPIRRTTDPAVNQIADVVNTLANPQWSEVSRNTQQVRIHNPDDFNQWVQVERITRVVFEDANTGAQFEWQYRPTQF